MEEVIDAEIVHEERSSLVIVAPHADDDLIGNFEVLTNPAAKSIILVYSTVMNNERMEETARMKEFLGDRLKATFYSKEIPIQLITPWNTIFVPDFLYEVHPEHKRVGYIGDSLFRKGLDVIFYTTNMNAPYVHEIKNPDEKEKALNDIYPSQSSLWKYEKKYVLFEGRCKFLL